MSNKPVKKTVHPTLVARVPKTLLRLLDEEARRNDRTRSAEARVRLEESLRRTTTPATASA